MKKMQMALCYKCQQKFAEAFDVKPDNKGPAVVPKKCESCNKANRDLKWFTVTVKRKGE